MENRRVDWCSAFSKVNPEGLRVGTSFSVNRILEDHLKMSKSDSSVTSMDVGLTPSISTFSYIPTRNKATVVAPQLPAWIYGTRFSRHGLPPGYNIRPSQRRPREKKARQIFSTEQIKRLEREFDEDRYVTAVKRVELASILGLTERQIKTWFQNRRTKWRKGIRAEITGNKSREPVRTNFLTFPGVMFTGSSCDPRSLSGHLNNSTVQQFSFPVATTGNSNPPKFFLNTRLCN